MKKIILCGWYGAKNTGDEAILTAILRELHEHQVVVFSQNPEHTSKQHQVMAVKHSLFNLPRLLQKIGWSDVFILGGGGLIQDKSSVYNLFRWLATAELALLFNKKVILYAVGIGPLNTRIGRFLTRTVLDRFEMITVRDEESKRILENIRVSKPKIIVDIDPALLLRPSVSAEVLQKLSRIDSSKPSFGICLNHWFYTHPLVPVKYAIKYNLRSKNNRQKFEKFLLTIAEVADHLAVKKKANIVFISFWPGRDEQVSKMVVERMRHRERALIVTGEYTPEEILGYISKMDLVVGMRLHSVIFAAAANIPFVGIKYSPKVRNFLEMMGQEKDSVDIENFGGEELVAQIDRVWRNSPLIKSNLQQKREYYKEKHEQVLAAVDLQASI